MEFSKVIQSRRSVRVFTSKPVPEAVMNQAIDHGLIAPNSSNMQAWEFYWPRQAQVKKQFVEACLNQSAARTAQEFLVIVSRIDTWNRNRKMLLERVTGDEKTKKNMQLYYGKLIPSIYFQDPLGLVGFFKWIVTTSVGLFRTVPRGPHFRSELFEVCTKSAALACENIMLSLVDQGFASCPMEGFDAVRVKKILGLGRNSHVVMILAIGEASEKGIWGDQIRLPRELFVKEI